MKKRKPHTHQSREAIATGMTKVWAERHDLDYKTAAVTARTLMYSDNPDAELLRSAVRRALATAPVDLKGSWKRVVAALDAGRTIRHKSFPVRWILPADPELVADLESAFV